MKFVYGMKSILPTRRKKIMSNLTHLFKVGQKVKCSMDGKLHSGTVKETYTDHIIVDVPGISNHCYFENGFNISDVYPEYNF